MTAPESIAIAGLMIFAALYIHPQLAAADWAMIFRAWGLG